MFLKERGLFFFLVSLACSQPLIIKNRLLYHLECPGPSCVDDFDKANHTVAREAYVFFLSDAVHALWSCTVGCCLSESGAAPEVSLCSCVIVLWVRTSCDTVPLWVYHQRPLECYPCCSLLLSRC